ncbi:MAG TPA: hypothetical protein DEB31_03235 [Clostridiales bacterium]|nr:hypothetical protein [Clostridiales bacterium]
MWCLFVGIGLGVLEILVLKKTVDAVTSGTSFVGLSVLISMGKLALILITLFLIAYLLDTTHMLWCAGGIAISMIGFPIVRGIRNIKKYKKLENRGEQ